ncbi:MAG: acyl-CoA dehydrogenase family protein, partial [Marmoricola sp.]
MSEVSDGSSNLAPTPEDFLSTAARIGREVLAIHADEVDSASRFPIESIQAMREAGMLGALVPLELGGSGLSMDTVSRAVTELGRHCSSSAM